MAKSQKATKPNKNTVSISPKLVTCLLGMVVAVLAIVSVCGQYITYLTNYPEMEFISLFDMDNEASVPAIFSVLLLFSAACLLCLITILKWKNKERYVASWGILTVGFLIMALDEGASIHEKLMPIMHMLLGDNLPSIFFFPWVIPAILAIAIMAPFFVKFLIDLPTKTKILFVLSALIYLGGALGAELVSGYYAGKFGMKNFGFNLIATVEEIMEMAGVILFIRSLQVYIEDHYGSIQFKFGGVSKPSK
jgi:hypothetical protein